MWWLVLASIADAQWVLEGPQTQVRAEASEVVWAATQLGHRARIERRYEHGVGTTFVALVEGIESETDAVRAATELTRRTGQRVVAYDRAHVQASGVPPESPPAIDQVRTRAWATEVPGLGDDVVFRFRRSTASGIEAVHRYVRRDGAVDLEVWVRDQPASIAAEWVESFSPSAIFAVPLRVAHRLGDGGADRLVDVGTDAHGNRIVRDPASPDVTYAFDGFLRLRVVSVSAGGRSIELRFEEYREPIPGVVLPFRLVRNEDGAWVETVLVEELTPG